MAIKFLYQKTNLLTKSAKYFGDKIGKKQELYSHTSRGFLPILAQKMKLIWLIKIKSIDLFFGIEPSQFGQEFLAFLKFQ
jgi:hypothetical protein